MARSLGSSTAVHRDHLKMIRRRMEGIKREMAGPAARNCHHASMLAFEAARHAGAAMVHARNRGAEDVRRTAGAIQREVETRCIKTPRKRSRR